MMMKRYVAVMALLCAILPVFAKNEVDTLFIERTRTIVISASADTILNEITTEVFSRNIRPDKRKSMMAGQAQKPKEHIPVRFAWGADAGASIDLTAQDMSDIEFSAFFGMQRGWLNFLGVGAAADFMTSNSSRSYPIFVDFRTNFVDRPTLFFWGLRGGISLNFLEHGHRQVGGYATTGLGINLARSKTFCSYIYIGYTFRQRRRIEGILIHDFRDIHYASVKLGITF